MKLANGYESFDLGDVQVEVSDEYAYISLPWRNIYDINIKLSELNKLAEFVLARG
jgi:hypothetical protein